MIKINTINNVSLFTLYVALSHSISARVMNIFRCLFLYEYHQ